jgi:hypothetical protein
MDGWTYTGFRRTLKLSITRTEKNGMEPTVTDVYDGKNLGDYVKGESNWTDEQLAQAPLTGDSSFNNRVAAFRGYIENLYNEKNEPGAVTGIIWANTRVGAEIYCKATYNKSSYQITYTLFTNCDDTVCSDKDCTNLNCTGSTTAKQDIIVNYDLLKRSGDDRGSKVASAYQATIKAGTTGVTTDFPIRNTDGTYVSVDGKQIYSDDSKYDCFDIELVYGNITTSTGDNPPMYVIEKVDALPFGLTHSI